MAEQQRFKVRFWGVRGSFPTPGQQTVRHGGNTSCVEVQAGPHILILDAGTGIIGLGKELLERAAGAPLRLSLFITHGHGDHLLGIPFFTPLYSPQTLINIFGPRLLDRSIEQLVTPIMSPPYFPVDIRTLPSCRTFYTISQEEQIFWRSGEIEPIIEPVSVEEELGTPSGRQIGMETLMTPRRPADAEVRVVARFTNSHPMDGALIYRIEYAGRRIVYSTDVEWKERCDPGFLSFVEGADLLIHDAQYTNHDYHQSKQGYGHSTLEMAIDVARAAHVRQLVLFHHEPTYDDSELDAMETEARTQFANTSSAYEGMEIDLLV